MAQVRQVSVLARPRVTHRRLSCWPLTFLVAACRGLVILGASFRSRNSIKSSREIVIVERG